MNSPLLASPGVALIVEDDPTNRAILASILKTNGFDVMEACDGLEAIAHFKRVKPDIIFMDISMPNMNGYEATKAIKAMQGHAYIPIVFLTASTDETQLSKCLQIGGDDFLTKPYSTAILLSKIATIKRNTALHRQNSLLLDRIVEDERIAEKVYQESVFSKNVAMDVIEFLNRPASIFSGDMLISEYSPARELYVLMGDFTGHGLAAALGSLPVAELFRNMTCKGHNPHVILKTLNSKLYTLLPTHMFMAAQLLTVRYDLSQITVFNCGMPDILVISSDPARITCRIASHSYPLGAVDTLDLHDGIQPLPVKQGDCVLLATDGLIEATNQNHHMYGQERVIQSILSADSAGGGILPSIISALDAFTDNTEQDDDVTLALIPIVPTVLPVWAAAISGSMGSGIDNPGLVANDPTEGTTLQLVLHGKSLRHADPIPLLIGNLRSTIDVGMEDQTLFIIVTELYLNALDQGLLKMDSSIKDHPDGFSLYAMEKQRRLRHIRSGCISIEVDIRYYHEYNQARIVVKHSGTGIKHTPKPTNEDTPFLCHERGIDLLRELCSSLIFNDDGKYVEAIYRWQAIQPA